MVKILAILCGFCLGKCMLYFSSLGLVGGSSPVWRYKAVKCFFIYGAIFLLEAILCLMFARSFSSLLFFVVGFGIHFFLFFLTGLTWKVFEKFYILENVIFPICNIIISIFVILKGVKLC